MSVAVLPERMEVIRRIGLARGSHPRPGNDDGVPTSCCVMEAVAYSTGRLWSDQPGLFCCTIEACVRRVNDATDQAGRQRLGAWVFGNLERLVATADDGFARDRALVAADDAVRRSLPRWLQLVGAQEAATTLRELPAIVDRGTAQAGGEAASVADPTMGSGPAARKLLKDTLAAAVRERLGDVFYAWAAADAADAAFRADPIVADVAAAADAADALPETVTSHAEVNHAAAMAARQAVHVAHAVALMAVATQAGEVANVGVDAAQRAADGATDREDAWSAVYEAVKAVLFEHAVAALDEQRVACGAQPAIEDAIELLDRLVSVGESTSAPAAPIGVTDGTEERA